MSGMRIFTFFSLAALSLGLVFQWLVLPLSPWYAGQGLMAGGDWVSFHGQAVELADKIRLHGWHMWELRYQGQWPASLLAVGYALTGWMHPSVVLPVYAVCYGIAAWGFAGVAKRLGVQGYWLWLALAALMLPSAVLIYGQPHKDAFSLAGVALLLRAWVDSVPDMENSPARFQALPKCCNTLALAAVGLVLMWLPRPYLAEVVSVTIFMGAVVMLLVARLKARWGIAMLPFLLSVGLCLWMLKAVEKVEKVELCSGWQPEWVIPVLHEKLWNIVCYRQNFIKAYDTAERGGGSSFDSDRLLRNYSEIIHYLPRAAGLAIVLPIPKLCHLTGGCPGTSPGGTVKRMLSSVEMLFFYAALLGIVFGFYRLDVRRKTVVSGLLVFALVVSVFYVLTSPNEGAIYRMRYPFFVLIWIVGIVGWCAFFVDLIKSCARRAGPVASDTNRIC